MNMRYICKQYIINTRINMKLRKNMIYFFGDGN